MRNRVDRAVMVMSVRQFQMSLRVGGINNYVAEHVIFDIYATEDQKNRCQANINYIEAIKLNHSTLSRESINELLHAINDLRSYLKHLVFFAGEQQYLLIDACATIKAATRSFFENIVDSMPTCGILKSGQLGYQSVQRLNRSNDKKLNIINDYLYHYHFISSTSLLRARYPDNAVIDLFNDLDSFVNSIEFNDACLTAWEKRLRTQNMQHLSHYLESRVHELMNCKRTHQDYFNYVLNKLGHFTHHLEKRAHFEINLMSEAVNLLHYYNQPVMRTVQSIMRIGPCQQRLYPVTPHYLMSPPHPELEHVQSRPQRTVRFFNLNPETSVGSFETPRASSPR